MSDVETLVNQFEKYCDVLKKVTPDTAVQCLSDKIGERFLMSPRGLKEEDGGKPGGLVDFSLKVAQAAKQISPLFGNNTKSLVKVSLLHELGRAGGLSKDEDLYVPQTSDWHRDKLGQMYTYNETCAKMNIAHRTLWLCTQLGFDLTREEWVAINVSQGLHLPENQFYANCIDGVAAGLLSARLAVLCAD